MNDDADRDESVSDETEPFSETEDDLGDLSKDDYYDAIVMSTDWTSETILNQIAKKNVDLSPEFQRRDAWSRQKKSRFIESLIVGLPVPQLVLAERKTGRGQFIVLDGKQRLLALQQFTDPSIKFRLSGLDLRTDLNGKTIETLPATDRNALEMQTIRTIVVRNWRNENFLYLVFLRLNTESVSLSPQELRQALLPGPFVAFANNYTADTSEFYNLFGRARPDFRMRDVELLVRHFAFLHYLPDYVGNLKPLLDQACKDLNRQWEQHSDRIKAEAEHCRLAILTTNETFGDDAFRRWSGKRYERPFNRAIFDVMTFYGRVPAIRTAMKGAPNQVIEAFKETCLRPEFTESVTTTTKSREAIYTRLKIWGDTLSTTLGIETPAPTIAEGGRIAYSTI